MKNKLIIILLTIVFTFVLAYASGFYEEKMTFIGSVGFALFSYCVNWVFRKEKSITFFISATFICLIFLAVVPALFRGKDLNYFAFVTAMFFIIAIIFGYALYNSQKMMVKIIAAVFFLITFFLSDYVAAFGSQQLFYETIDGKANYIPNPDDLNVIDGKNLKNLNLLDFKEKIIVLDFWNNRCGECFKKFPKMQALQNKYKDNEKIGFYALNSFGKDNEIEEGQKIFDSLEYKFKTYFQSREKSKNLKVNGYPTVLVLKKSKIVFIGSVEVLSALDFIYLK